MPSVNDFFTTYDLNLSAVLVASGFPLDSLEKPNSGKALFYFARSAELDEVVQLYWAQQIRLNPHALFNALKFLKNRIYSSY
jgi:hypothetical protein